MKLFIYIIYIIYIKNVLKYLFVFKKFIYIKIFICIKINYLSPYYLLLISSLCRCTVLWRALDGSHGIRDFVGLGLGSPRSPEGHTTGLNFPLIITLDNNDLFNNKYSIYLYTCFLMILLSSVSAETLRRIALRVAALTCLTFGLGT